MTLCSQELNVAQKSSGFCTGFWVVTTKPLECHAWWSVSLCLVPWVSQRIAACFQREGPAPCPQWDVGGSFESWAIWRGWTPRVAMWAGTHAQVPALYKLWATEIQGALHLVPSWTLPLCTSSLGLPLSLPCHNHNHT